MERSELAVRLTETFEAGCVLANEYDARPRCYGGETLHRSEVQMLRFVGKHPKTTATEIALAMNKTVSACSQVIRKLRAKNLIKQLRNETNNREYYLELTELGCKVFEARGEFEQERRKRLEDCVSEFSDKEMSIYIEIQECLNEMFES